MRVLALLFTLLACGLHADPSPLAQRASCTITAQAAGLEVRLCDLSFSSHQKDKATMLWDTASNKQALSALAPEALSTAAEALVRGQALLRYPKVKLVVALVVEATERDSYGLPRWDTMKILKRLEFVVSKDGKTSLKAQ
jgi:hypothetical protein